MYGHVISIYTDSPQPTRANRGKAARFIGFLGWGRVRRPTRAARDLGWFLGEPLGGPPSRLSARSPRSLSLAEASGLVRLPPCRKTGNRVRSALGFVARDAVGGGCADRASVLKCQRTEMTYEYACEACGHEWEAEQSIREQPIKKCPHCGKLKAKRQISRGAGFILKGGGWYADGYGSSSGGSGGKKSEGGGSSSSGSGSGGSSSSEGSSGSSSGSSASSATSTPKSKTAAA